MNSFGNTNNAIARGASLAEVADFTTIPEILPEHANEHQEQAIETDSMYSSLWNTIESAIRLVTSSNVTEAQVQAFLEAARRSTVIEFNRERAWKVFSSALACSINPSLFENESGTGSFTDMNSPDTTGKYNYRIGGAIESTLLNNVDIYTQAKSNSCRKTYRRACIQFAAWCKANEISSRKMWRHRRPFVMMWACYLLSIGRKPDTVHGYVTGVCCGLRIYSGGIVGHGTAAEKTKSLGFSEEAWRARTALQNMAIVAFQEMVGGRRNAILRLTGSDFVMDESGYWCVRFIRDKGGKTQLQRVAPEDVEKVRAYFEAVGPNERLFKTIDKRLDLHGIRAEHARREYWRYAHICSTPEGREQMRAELLARFTHPNYGCKKYLLALDANNEAFARRVLDKYIFSMRDGTYCLKGVNRQVALERGVPTEYDRLALMCVSVFALSHWRNGVTVKHYML